MNILLLNRSYYPNIGGIENSLYCMSKELRGSNHGVSILTEQPRKSGGGREEYAEIIYYPRFGCPKLLLPLSPVIYLKKTVKWLRENKHIIRHDMVITRDPLLGMAVKLVCPGIYMVYIPAVVIKYYNKRPAPGIKKWLRYLQLKTESRYQKKICGLSNKIIVFSRNVQLQLIESKTCAAGKPEVIYPGTADKFKTVRPDRDAVSNTEPNFLYVGRLVKEKNLGMLMRAFALLGRGTLIIVGGGDERKKLEQLAGDLNIGGKTIFCGYLQNPETEYRRASYFVIPSVYEAFGQVIAEALTCSLPVIGFATIPKKTLTAVEELIQDGKTGFVCRQFDAHSLAECMRRADMVFRDKTEYEAMRSRCGAYARERFSWKKLADRITDKGD
jgi:1,2-diacylglycerol 3-alpha-glucosyltransferase